ncbi:helix-turn-helix transcriptional regulator [Legionella feeleii]|uniref:Helix-turn-helix domain n=1 Tax=Legionella feeleii TaxID=453 RepID=A0A0W0U3M3_9GAMM|nr:helix-turn-helix domain-containing protein [Legionella feeleii]KTD02659.1 Helix-turn-helix domain protein [Legionella feeleii]SPX61215.1 Helix-turn-helix domain [Legionella feeleii]
MKQESLLLYPKQAQKFLGIGATKFYELVKLSNFPKAKTPLGKRPMYLREELEKWVKNLE